MPCFLFTFHAYGSWLPHRPEGFVHWKHGLQPADEGLADAYRKQMKLDEAEFSERLQRLLVDELKVAAEHQRFRLHAVTTEATHVHVLLSWPDERPPSRLAEGVKKSLSLRLAKDAAKRKWLTKGTSQRRVKDQQHFDYLLDTYLPSHGGWKWDERRGVYK
ncbi:MAG: hypothetical protein DCC67_13895 [Planctomycetota bacterium]|nr:MAG: hypothetical protein DCC67_13895 [Planctomycetota bacterium]